MRQLLVFALALLGSNVAAAVDLPADLAGYWEGYLADERDRHELAVEITASASGELSATFDWPTSGYLHESALGVKRDGERLSISLPLPLGALKLRGTYADGSVSGSIEQIGRVAGDWKSLGTIGTFTLTRGKRTAEPYQVRDVEFRSGDAVLSGSLFDPERPQSPSGVVYLHGSGDVTRSQGIFLADRLARAGIAVLVYDKRGTGASTGDWRRAGFDGLAADANAALAALIRSGVARDGGFLCVSQGCWIAPLAISRGAPARFLVSISGPTVTVAEEDLDHYRVILTEAGFGDADVQAALDFIAVDQRVSEGRTPWGELEQLVARVDQTRWFEALGWTPLPVSDPERVFFGGILRFDPRPPLDQLRIPSLWLYGESDTIIPVRDSIMRLQDSRASPAPRVLILPQAGHMLTRERAGLLPRLASDVPGIIAEWLLSQAARAPQTVQSP